MLFRALEFHHLIILAVLFFLNWFFIHSFLFCFFSTLLHIWICCNYILGLDFFHYLVLSLKSSLIACRLLVFKIWRVLSLSHQCELIDHHCTFVLRLVQRVLWNLVWHLHWLVIAIQFLVCNLHLGVEIVLGIQIGLELNLVKLLMLVHHLRGVLGLVIHYVLVHLSCLRRKGNMNDALSLLLYELGCHLLLLVLLGHVLVSHVWKLIVLNGLVGVHLSIPTSVIVLLPLVLVYHHLLLVLVAK